MRCPSPSVRYGGAALAVLLGTAWQVMQPALWPVWVDLAMVGGAVGLGVMSLRMTLGVCSTVSLALAWGLFAAGQAGWRAGERLAQQLDPALEDRALWVTGEVEGLPRAGPDGVSFIWRIEQGWDVERAQAVTLPERVWLHWPTATPGEGLAALPPPWVQAGERWRLPMRLRRVHGLANPGGFDAEGWMFGQGWGALGTVRAGGAGAVPQRLGRVNSPGAMWDRWRQRWRDEVLLRVADPQAAGLLAALAVGDQAAIAPTDWQTFRDTGISHLVSISGLHITLFAWLVTGVLRRAQPWLPLHTLARWGWPAAWVASVGGLALATAYAVLAGWGVPARRTVWMLALVTLLRLLGRRWPGGLVCSVSGAAVLLCDPWAVEQAGFWLSFVAVMLLIVSDAPPVRDAANPPPARSAWREGLRAQWVASLGLAPLTLLLFNQVSIVGFGVNWVAVPLVTFVLTPLALGGLLLPGCWTLAGWIVSPCLQALAWLAAWPGAVWEWPSVAPWAGLSLLLSGVVAVWPGLGWRRWGAVLLAWPLFGPGGAARPPVGAFDLLAADVGQGSAVLLRTAQHSLLFDAGPISPSGRDAGTQVLIPLLRHLGEPQLDALVLSHEDSDHIGGAPALLAARRVQQMWVSLPVGHRLWAAPVPVKACAAGGSWVWEGVTFRFLHPPAASEPRPAVKGGGNAHSCVLHVRDAQGRSALLTGDLPAEQEQTLSQHTPDTLRADVLVVPHHGSRTSSSEALLAAVRPQWAVVQVGYRSRFGHPHSEVLARYAAQGIKLVRSDHCGAMTWQSAGSTPVVDCTRIVHQRQWHWRCASSDQGCSEMVRNQGRRREMSAGSTS